ncbi:aminoacyl-tRNA hydrolase [Pseudogracilibacillus sp. SE30717A]|uniref:aminoacyl-tRNA hydrolase n=1 Tax=Pseudogracilibacillus sp. SE30717A TaxID=3098293 RepID=UPI00300E4D3E
MKCIVGLGNPGKKYESTRHNIGFIVLDELARRNGFTFDENKYKSDFYVGFIQQEKVLFIKPQTFMNLSGEGVKPLLDFYKIDYTDTLVVYDDLDLPTGKIRLREKGGHGGHNGIRSLIDHLSTREFKRLRIGIGRPQDQTPVVNYVLQPFSKDDLTQVDGAIEQASRACEAWLTHSFSDVMNEYNK